MKKLVVFCLCAAILLFATLSTAKAELRCGWWVNLSDKTKLQGWATSYGANLVHLNWALDGYIQAPTTYSIANIRSFLDEAQKYGIVVSVSISTVAFGKVSDSVFSTFINGLKDHPALWGWYIGDEPELYSGTHQNLLHYYSLCKQLDPAHKCWVVNSGSVNRTFGDVTDFYAVDLYPKSSTSGEFGDSYVRQSYDYWKKAYDIAIADNKGPLTILPQGMGVGYQNYGDLTVNELRYHAFSAVVLGIDKIFFWTYTESNPTMESRVNQAIKQITDIKTEMVNGSTNDSKIMVSQPTTNVTYRYGANGSSNVILAVNIASRTSASGQTLSNVQFTLPAGVRPSQVEVVGEARTLPVTNGVFTDNFNRFAVHIYKFSATATNAPSPPTGLRIVS